MALSERNRRVAYIVGGIVALGALVCVICGVVGAFQMNRFVGDMQAGLPETLAEADAFATGHDQLACRDESVRRMAACAPSDIGCGAQQSVFLERCLDRATPSAGLCTGVPRLLEIMPSVQWGAATCRDLGYANDGRCPQLMQAVQRYCEHPR